MTGLKYCGGVSTDLQESENFGFHFWLRACRYQRDKNIAARWDRIIEEAFFEKNVYEKT